MYTYELPVSEIIHLSPNANATRVGLQGKEFSFLPGQYAQIELQLKESEQFKVLNNEPRTQKRTFSISSSPLQKGYLELTTKAIDRGLVSVYLLKYLKLGDIIKLKGPLGKFFFDEKTTKKNIVFLAAGSGISPLMSMIRYIHEKKISINTTLLYSNKTQQEILWKEEIETMVKTNAHIKHVFTLTQEAWQGRTGRIDKDLVFSYVKEKENTDFYVCGPPTFVEGIEQILKQQDIPMSAIKKEIF